LTATRGTSGLKNAEYAWKISQPDTQRESRLAEHIANVRFKQLAGCDFRQLRYSGEIRSVSPYRNGGDVGYKSGLALA
jgi:hypothetical protein